ncbi:histone H1.8 [Dendrobates tinctorius]|uniref:histone H1.8 n=1 Tax=Dendrobates tinctorius TaxID=92724 RepID=UPI003CC93EDC
MGPKKAADGAKEEGDAAAVSTLKETKAKQKVVKVKTMSHPSTLSMVVEAIKKDSERKGTSVQAIRNRILLAHPTVDPVRLRFLLKAALNKGIEKGILVRPTNSNASGATGRFKLAKPGAKPKVEGENVDPNVQPKEKTEKPKKKVVKVSKKPKAAKGEPKADENMGDKAADKKERPPEAKAAGSKPKKSAAEKMDKGLTAAKKPKAKALSAEEGAKPKKEPAKKKAKDGEEKPTAKSSKKGKK